MGTGTGAETETRAEADIENGAEDRNGDGNKDEIGEGGEANKRKQPHKSCRRDVGNGGGVSGKRKNVDKKGLVQ